MPLMKGKSEKAFKHNVGVEMEAGKPKAQSLAIAYATKRRGKKMAHGGDVGHPIGAEYEHEEEMEPAGHEAGESAHEEAMEHSSDMIARIMHKHHKYSQGGMVANDVGVAEADKEPAEFDDLVLDDHLEGEQPEDSNEHGEHVSDDPIDRIMMKRKKDKMPRPA